MNEYGKGYISKDSLMRLFKWDNDIEKWVIWDDDLNFALTEKNDVAPVIHAYWRGIWGDGYAEDENGNMQIVYEEFECSNCGCVHDADGEPTWDYCPECGSRMDGGEDNEIFSNC